jgi:hypothetical protein
VRKLIGGIGILVFLAAWIWAFTSLYDVVDGQGGQACRKIKQAWRKACRAVHGAAFLIYFVRDRSAWAGADDTAAADAADVDGWARRTEELPASVREPMSYTKSQRCLL